jgi:hypothetical protein
MAKAPADLRSLARSHTETCVRTLAMIVRHKKAPMAARVAAASALLDRGWGKPAQPHTGEDGQDIRITIRKMLTDQPVEPAGDAMRVVIEGGDVEN